VSAQIGLGAQSCRFRSLSPAELPLAGRTNDAHQWLATYFTDEP